MAQNIVEPIEDYGLSKKSKPKSLFSKVGIIGFGTSGQAIARIISRQGIEVTFIETDEKRIKAGLAGLERDLDRIIGNWGLTESDKRAILSRVKGFTDYKKLEGCDLVLEAILSNKRESSVEDRKEIFKKIEAVVEPYAIIATNSSTSVITELSAELEHKDRCVSLHFSTLSTEARLVEVARGLHTSDEAYDNTAKFITMLGKTAIPVDESPGLVTVRMFVPLINEACHILMEGTASMEDIDFATKESLSLAIGPFEMADKIGLDRIFRWSENLYREFGDMHYKSSPLIKKRVRANQLGRKTGKGFYTYDENGKRIK
ncbi:MAG TPA: 3-hydroxybutyryl-CoA dehydrogenase [Bacteroidales bacterium]|nr:3-hydroxybutyryl-CoA dehydrogenase [Bacteroidales bacterium]